jgi:wyosine [tRNA(Phe)-imidazoG37] synthetase (radical SAM superfamily)
MFFQAGWLEPAESGPIGCEILPGGAQFHALQCVGRSRRISGTQSSAHAGEAASVSTVWRSREKALEDQGFEDHERVAQREVEQFGHDVSRHEQIRTIEELVTDPQCVGVNGFGDRDHGYRTGIASASDSPRTQATCRGHAFAGPIAVPLSPLEPIVYGPVRSRRLGTSLGINLLPAGMKICNMNCAYCQYGWTRGATRSRGQDLGWPAPQAVEEALSARLSAAAERNEVINRLTVAGHGEPTLHPEFEKIATRLRSVRDRIAPGLPLAILSNSTTAAADDVRGGLGAFDERYMKLDAGDSITFATLNGGGRHLSDIVDSLRTLSPIVVQAMFVRDERGAVDNSRGRAVRSWLDALDSIRATGVHIYTIDRSPALESLRPVHPRRLREIAEQVRALGIHAQVFASRCDDVID